MVQLHHARSRQSLDESRAGRDHGHEVCIANGMQLDLEEIDLEKLAEVVKRRAEGPLVGAITGRSIVRDIVAAHLGCSLLQAEQLVDTMIARGFARLERDDEGRQFWRMTKGV